MPPKKKPVKKTKQKQKQKQVVKQSVRVNVQSSGGSGGGGSSGPVPMQFRDTSGENQRLVSLVEQIARSRPPVQVQVQAPASIAEKPNPENDEATIKEVFSAPLNTNKPVELGPSNERPIARKRTKIPISEKMTEAEAGYVTASSEEEYKPLGYSFLQQTKTPYGKIVPKYAVDPFSESSSIVSAPKQKESPAPFLQQVGGGGKTFQFIPSESESIGGGEGSGGGGVFA